MNYESVRPFIFEGTFRKLKFLIARVTRQALNHIINVWYFVNSYL